MVKSAHSVHTVFIIDQTLKLMIILSEVFKRIFVSRKPQLIFPKGLHYRGQALEFFITIFLSVAAAGVLGLTLYYNNALPFISAEYIPLTEGALFIRLFVLALTILLIPAAIVSWFLLRFSGRQKLLKERVEFYAQLFYVTTDSIIVHDLDGRCIYANERACQFYGYDEEELLRINLYELNSPEQAETVKAKIAELIEKKQLTFESVHICKNKPLTPVEISSLIIESGGRKLIVSAVSDISERKRTAEELRQTSLRLQRAIEGAINAVALTTEIRDPYTAGHQHRVAKLACSIGRELGLSEKQIEGVRVAGTLHDIGKIYVPAEILSRPGRLRQNEINLVKDHAQVGYDLLSTIEFPWPVAQIVLQHHERMNGSGYPFGLSGDDILIEAQIMSVADVVEAMASHRPYRPALSIEEALLEISQQRGVLYSPEAVDACIKVFTQKGFKFENSS
jgi:PAS domain S-box-containing protein/putative nucleotidyltransferase with HDIG domain